MKKTMTWMALSGMLFLSGCGSNITKDEALNIALKDAGVSKEEVTMTKEAQSDDGYEFAFYTDEYSYQYEIEEDGAIEDKEMIYLVPNQEENGEQNTGAISKDDALAKAYAYFEVDSKKATMLEVQMDRDDGRDVYDIEFMYEGKEYSCEIDRNSGEIVSHDVDVH